MILTPEMLREVAKDIEIVATSRLGRVNIGGLLMAAAVEIERLQNLNNKMVMSIADGPKSAEPANYVERLDDEVMPTPTEKDLAKEMAPVARSGKKSRK